MREIDRIASQKNHTGLWVCVGLVVAVVAALWVGGSICLWAEERTEQSTQQQSTQQEHTAGIEWCAVCLDYQHTFIGSVGSVLVCSVCDTILAW